MQPDPQAPGFWVDQWNGRHCGGDPRYPHYAVAAKKSNTVLIVAGCVGGALVLIAAVALAGVFLYKNADKPTVVQAEPSRPDIPTAAPSVSARPSEKPAESSSPEAPVPCDESQPRGSHCFPVSGPEFLRRVEKALEWRCYKAGEKDAFGHTVRDPECQTRNQTNTRSARISYTGHRESKMDRLSVSAAARGLNGDVQPEEATKLGTEIFGQVVTQLWPEDQALQREARQALAGLRKDCQDDDPDNDSAKLSAGYEISCSKLRPITVRHDDGQVVTTISDIMSITVPFDYAWD